MQMPQPNLNRPVADGQTTKANLTAKNDGGKSDFRPVTRGELLGTLDISTADFIVGLNRAYSDDCGREYWLACDLEDLIGLAILDTGGTLT